MQQSKRCDKNYSKMRMIASKNVILFKYGQTISNMELFILEYARSVRIAIEFAFNNYNRNRLTRRLVVLKIKVSN